ncbi:MAG: PKD domain-containing protein [Chitinophagaceae bacterium]|nr:PKD domain-containing protein [Chitinophagaceae bacterium]
MSDTYAQFTDTSRIASGIINAWNWNFGDPVSGPNNTSTLQNPQHSYTSVGTYNVELIVTSNNGCRDTIVQQLTVNGSFPVANFTVNNPTTLCANDSVAIVEASTVFPGVITKIEIYWDNVNFPAVFDVDDLPFTGKVYRHLYPNFQAPLTRVFTIRYKAYSGGVCVNDRIANITVNAAPLVQFNAMPDTCFLATPFQITQASEIGGVPGTGVFTGPGISPTGIFSPAIAGIGTHTIMYTFTSAVGGCVDTMSNTITVLDTATAAFTYVSPICELVPASFTDVSTAPATVTLSNTVWNFGDGTPIENHPAGSTFTHMFPAPGTYTVTMYNVSAYGCNSTVTSQSVTVDANHIITLNAGSNDNQTVCINTAIAPILYTLSGGATGATVTGLPPGVTAQVTGNTLTISGTPSTTAASPYTYSVLTTGNTCVIADTTGVITVEPDHTITLTSAASTTDQSVCVNSAINNITYNLGGGASGVTITGLPPGVIYLVTGNTLTISGTPNTTAGGPAFAYSIITTGNTCITAAASGTIDVNPYPVPNFAVDKPSYCIPNAIVSFINGSTMPDGSGMTYLWNFGEPLSPNNTSTSVNPSHWYSGTGPFDVTLTVSSLAILNGGAVGCTHDTIIQVNTIHPQPKADFTYNKPSVCIGDNVTITDNTDGKDGIVNQWHWDMGDGAIRTTNPVTYTYFDTITYNITMYSINSHGCNSDTITKTFTVYPYPYVNAGPDRFVLEGGSIQLETITFANDAQYNWTPNLYLSDNHVARPRVNDPKTDMTYRLTVTGRGGCTTSDNVFVKLLKFPVIPNTFTPNGDAINDTWRIDFLNTYPNNRVQAMGWNHKR